MEAIMSNDYEKIGESFGKIENELLYLVYRDFPEILRTNMLLGKRKIDVLVFGCGPGLSTGEIKKIFAGMDREAEIVGIDRSNENIRLAKATGYGKFLWMNDSEIPVPFQNKKYDVVFCIFVLLEQETKKDIENIICSIRDSLEPGGLLITLNTTVDAYDPKNEWVYLNNQYQENVKSILGVSGIDRLKLALKNTEYPIEFDDVLWREEDYEEVFSKCKMEVVSRDYTFGHKDEPIPWKSELTTAPYVIHTLKKF